MIHSTHPVSLITQPKIQSLGKMDRGFDPERVCLKGRKPIVRRVIPGRLRRIESRITRELDAVKVGGTLAVVADGWRNDRCVADLLEPLQADRVRGNPIRIVIEAVGGLDAGIPLPYSLRRRQKQ